MSLLARIEALEARFDRIPETIDSRVRDALEWQFRGVVEEVDSQIA